MGTKRGAIEHLTVGNAPRPVLPCFLAPGATITGALYHVYTVAHNAVLGSVQTELQ